MLLCKIMLNRSVKHIDRLEICAFNTGVIPLTNRVCKLRTVFLSASIYGPSAKQVGHEAQDNGTAKKYHRFSHRGKPQVVLEIGRASCRERV